MLTSLFACSGQMSFPDGLDPGAGVCTPPAWSGLVPKISAIGKKTPIVTMCMVLWGECGGSFGGAHEGSGAQIREGRNHYI